MAVVKCGHAVIAPGSASIKAGGLAGEPLKITLDIYPEGPQQITDILNLRGKELVVVFATVDQADSVLKKGTQA